MFETLSALQPENAEHIEAQLQQGRFAQVNLFSGPAYSLRMSFALECIRVLECQGNGTLWCPCQSCTSWRTLSMENLVIVSRRDHRSIIESAIEAWERLGTDERRYHLIRAIRILLLAYHPQLATLAEAAALNDLLTQVDGQDGQEQGQRSKVAKDLRQGLRRLLAEAKKNPTITIAQVRSIAEWVSRSSVGSDRRYIIIEAMEETNMAARNALLKLLEEPPEGVYFFLISEHPNRIMQTILSRSRHTRFGSLTKEAVARYLQSWYPDKTYPSLGSYFLEHGGLDLRALAQAADTIKDSIIRSDAVSSVDLATILASIDAMDGYEHFLHLLVEGLASAQRLGELDTLRASVLMRSIAQSYFEGELYNQDVRMMGQGLYYTLLEVR